MKQFSTLMLLLLFMGCSGPVTYTKLSNKNFSPTIADNVEVYIDENPVNEFVKIALISTNMWKENLATNIEYIKRKAAKLGAEAIVLIRADPHSSGGGFIASPAGNTFMALRSSGQSGYNYSAYAIRFIER